ncbi:beta-aspartyl-peptidase [Clostridium sp. KNHs216]|uniref:beta-aspartyl-peptidase n=1 Tax=Clostridium sp. KNHs216 TaxID=1550235 RepID=UPI0011535F51|nr:beta-aspartyl-peptidase [Clostridium sp. KNHs216]TQI68312.1 beta-aspartyl-dipeptidase (metallo-type) [Clostridium sp. KNHs216]
MLLIKNVRVNLNHPNEVADVFIAGGKIQAIGRKLEPALANLEVLDGDGKTAIPGYIDQHVHITGGGGEDGFSSRVPEIQLSDCIRGGVTTLVGLLGTDSITRSVENVVAKTKALRSEGLTAYCLTGAYEYPSPTLTGSVKKDIAYIEEVIGVKIAISDHRSSNLCKQDLIRLASEARLGGLLSRKPGLVHIHVGTGKRKLGLLFDILETEDIPIQIFRPTHVGRVFDDAVRFANLGGYIDFTAEEESRKSAQMIVKAFEQAPAERITLSTDSNGSMPKWNENKEIVGMGVGQITTLHRTVKSLVQDCGVPLSQAILTGTATVAKALGLADRKGLLAEGYDADLILLDDRLNIDTVMAGGAIMMKSGSLIKKGIFEK